MSEKKISLANGYCHILPLYLVISEYDNTSELLRRKDRNSYPIFILLCLLAASFFFISAIYLINAEKYNDSIGALLPFLFCLSIAFYWRKRSNVKVIERSQIRNIQLKKVLFNPAFVVLFKNQKGKFKERVLVMDSKSPKEIGNAVKLLKSENLMRTDLQPDFEQIVNEIKSQKTQQETYKTGSESTVELAPDKPKFKRGADGYVKDY